MAAHSPETTREREAPRTTATPHDGRAPATTSGHSGGALASMIVGIIAIPAVLIPILAIVMGIVAIVLGASARKKGATNSGQAMAGIICGSIGLILALGIIVLAAASAS
jgi:expansin (peptidoglycan-binding protein)